MTILLEALREHEDLVLEAERRRIAIGHLLRWKSRALKMLTDEQIEELENGPR
jgi:hypothetical protein